MNFLLFLLFVNIIISYLIHKNPENPNYKALSYLIIEFELYFIFILLFTTREYINLGPIILHIKRPQ